MKNFESFSTDWRVPDPTLQILIHFLRYQNNTQHNRSSNLLPIVIQQLKLTYHKIKPSYQRFLLDAWFSMQGSAYFMRAIEIATLHAKSIFQNNILSFKKHAWKNRISLFTEAPLCKWDEMIPPMTCSWQMTHPFFGMTDSHDTPRAKDRTHRVLTQWVSGSWHHSRGSRHLRRPPFRWGVTGIGWAHPIC